MTTPTKAEQEVQEKLEALRLSSRSTSSSATAKYSVLNVVSTTEPLQLDLTETPVKTPREAEEETPKRSPAVIVDLPKEVRAFIQQLHKANNVIVMVGAGLSVAAGIPDFRTPGTGLYSQLAKYNLPAPEAVFEINYFKRNPQPFRQLASELWPGRKYLPTVGHHFIKLMHDKNKLLRCYTQNIDSLEGMTGLPKEKIVAAHGNFDSATCVFTRKKIPNMDEVRDAYLSNKHQELNDKYGTILVKPDIVFFGFHELVPRDFEKCDLLIVMGTSLQVHPFASLIYMPKRGTPRMLINRERVGDNGHPKGFQFSKSTSDVFLQGDCDDGCLKLADGMGWGDELREMAKREPLL